MNCASTGKLYIVATPIGNMEDITLRALSTLKSVDVILSEDTRETEKLLKQYQIEKPQIPYTDQKHHKMLGYVLDTLKSGKNVALVSDSGTPVISDPGYSLVREMKKQGLEVISVPGPSSVVAALSVSGLPTDKFIFIGFLPKSEGKRKDIIKKCGMDDASIVIFESPTRIKKTLTQINEVLGNRTICLVKDLTKHFERVETDLIENILKTDIKEKGEYIIIVAKEGFSL